MLIFPGLKFSDLYNYSFTYAYIFKILDLPKDYNVYIEHVLEAVLEPVLEGVNKLKQTTQLSVVSMATVAVCDAWIAFIMKERIKFRLEFSLSIIHSGAQWLSW